MGLLDRVRRLLRGRPAREAGPSSGSTPSTDAPASDARAAAGAGGGAGGGKVLDLPDGGLSAAVEALAARQPVPVTLGLDVPGGLARTVEAAAYRAVERDLVAVVAEGASRASVVLTYDDGALRVEVTDDAWHDRATDVPTRS